MPRGVARNLMLRGTKEGIWGRKSPSGVQGQSPGEGQKPETNANFQLRAGEHAPMSPLAAPMTMLRRPLTYVQR